MNYIGEKYEQTKDLDIKEIAKLIRADIKFHFNNTIPGTLDLPQSKFSVRIERYSMGQSINIEVTEVPEKYRSATLDLLRMIVRQYNYENSEELEDQFDVRYYTNISIV